MNLHVLVFAAIAAASLAEPAHSQTRDPLGVACSLQRTSVGKGRQMVTNTVLKAQFPPVPDVDGRPSYQYKVWSMYSGWVQLAPGQTSWVFVKDLNSVGFRAQEFSVRFGPHRQEVRYEAYEDRPCRVLDPGPFDKVTRWIDRVV